MIDGEIVKQAAAGATGSGLAVWIAKVTGMDMIVMFIGGFVSSLVFGEAVAHYFNLIKYEAAVGFVVGFLSILVLRKLYETLQGLDAKDLGQVLVDKVRSLLGVQK